MFEDALESDAFILYEHPSVVITKLRYVLSRYDLYRYSILMIQTNRVVEHHCVPQAFSDWCAFHRCLCLTLTDLVSIFCSHHSHIDSVTSHGCPAEGWCCLHSTWDGRRRCSTGCLPTAPASTPEPFTCGEALLLPLALSCRNFCCFPRPHRISMCL